MKVITDEKIIDSLLSRSVKEVLPSKESLKERLLSGERLRIYIGTDATGTSLHLGHATNYLILEEFRKLGHEVIFLVGDFTSRIGDPTDKTATRVSLSREEVVSNVKTWIDQIRPIVDIDNSENPVRVLYNHEWLSQLSFEEILHIASQFTVQHMLERDMFEKRIQEQKPIYLHEFLYPLMQGYDSVAMDIDIEMCGNDQEFNALAGRTLLRKLKNKEKFVFITTLLENPKTGEKMMSKSLGTGVYLDTHANDMFGGIMSQPDENMRQLFIDATRLSYDEIDEVFKMGNPRDSKLKLAFEITKLYHGEKKAQESYDLFLQTFSKKGIPDDIEEIMLYGEKLADVLVKNGIVSSKTEWRRLVEEGAVKTENDEKIVDKDFIPKENMVLKIGKRRFVKIIV